jgi:hypothetical protein
MKLMSGLGRWFGLGAQRRIAGMGGDPADMGTAFGLDAITIVPDDTPSRSLAETEPVQSGFQRRLDRRSSL